MRTVISVARPYHTSLMANSIFNQGLAVEIYTSASRRFYKGLSDSVRTHFVPSPLQIAGHVFNREIPWALDRLDNCLFDASVSRVMGNANLYFGWPAQSLSTATRTKKHGGIFVLDRACPHRDFQQDLVERESERLGLQYRRQPEWFRDRQLEEYELADAILVPSEYTLRTFPEPLRHKLVKAPLLGRCREPKTIKRSDNGPFTVGVLGGSPVRKGYLYLLKAWKKLSLKNAKLLLRSGNLTHVPVLRELMRDMSDVEFVDYVPEISDFYLRCDVFVLPSVDDGFGMALIEAMLNGRACIATSNTGASELITNGTDGIVVGAGDEDQIAQAILRLYESKNLREEIGAAAAVRAKQIAASRLYEGALCSLLKNLKLPH